MLRAEDLLADISAILAEYPELADDEELRADVLEGETEIDAVLTRLVSHVQEANATDEAIASMVSDLSARRKRFQSRAAFFRALIKRVMTAANLPKRVLPNATLSVRAVPPSVNVMDGWEGVLPIEYVVTKSTPDKKAIADALKAGKTVPGATLSNGGETLSIRV